MIEADRIQIKRAFDSAVIGGSVPPAHVLAYVAELAVEADPVPCWEEGTPKVFRYEVRKDTGYISRTVLP